MNEEELRRLAELAMETVEGRLRGSTVNSAAFTGLAQELFKELVRAAYIRMAIAKVK